MIQEKDKISKATFIKSSMLLSNVFREMSEIEIITKKCLNSVENQPRTINRFVNIIVTKI